MTSFRPLVETKVIDCSCNIIIKNWSSWLYINLHIVPFPKHNHCITYFPIVLFQNIQLSKVICLLLRAFIKRLTKWWLSCVVSSFKIQCDVRNKIFGRNEKFIFYSVFSRFIFRKIHVFSKMCMCIYKQSIFTMYLVRITMWSTRLM